MKATDIIQHFAGTATDTVEISTGASFLKSLGWDFTEDYENWVQGNYSGQPYTEEQLQSYDSFLNVSVVVIHIKESGDTYFGMRHQDWENPVECSVPTGDDKLTLKDIAENLDSFSTI